MPHSLTNNLLATAGVRVVASQEALQARRHDKRPRIKAHKSNVVLLVTLASSYIDGCGLVATYVLKAPAHRGGAG